MAENTFTVEDYLAIARTRTTEQFTLESAPVFDKYLQLLISGFQEAQEIFDDLMKLRGVDTATGAQLDIIGNIVGQDRELIAADLYDFFGMQGALNAFPMGDRNDPTVGGIFYSAGTDFGGNVQLDDDLYRLFIKAKIYKNNTSSTPEQFIQAIRMIFDAEQVALVESGNANAYVYIGKQLSNFEKILLTYISSSAGYPSRLIPKTVGVGLGFGQFDSNNYFGFTDSPGAKGFGDLTGTYGYGLGYGLNYGLSDYGLGDGGTFASLIQLI